MGYYYKMSFPVGLAAVKVGSAASASYNYLSGENALQDLAEATSILSEHADRTNREAVERSIRIADEQSRAALAAAESPEAFNARWRAIKAREAAEMQDVLRERATKAAIEAAIRSLPKAPWSSPLCNVCAAGPCTCMYAFLCLPCAASDAVSYSKPSHDQCLTRSQVCCCCGCCLAKHRAGFIKQSRIEDEAAVTRCCITCFLPCCHTVQTLAHSKAVETPGTTAWRALNLVPSQPALSSPAQMGMGKGSSVESTTAEGKPGSSTPNYNPAAGLV